MAIVTVGLNAPTQDDIDSFKAAFQITGTGGGTGEDGKSAYEIAILNGFVGTEAQWLNSLHGADGAAGPAGPQGIQGKPGQAGLAGANGIDGTIGAPGPQGVAGPSAYQIAVSNGFVGNEQDWLNSLWGPQGIQGPVGPQGEAGPQGIQGLPGAQGPKGDKGDKGDTGAQGIPGDTGPQGATGLQGLPGLDGSQGPQGPQGIQGVQGPAGMNGEDGTDATVTYQAVIDALGYTPGTGDGTGNANTADITSAINAHIAAADPHGLTYPLTPGGYAVNITGSDLNSLYRTGFFRGCGLVNAPLDDSGWWHILIASHDADWVKQTATAFGAGNNAGDIYERVCNNGAWTSWAKVFKGTSIDGTPIGQTTPAAGAFTTLSATGNLTGSGSGTFGGNVSAANGRLVLRYDSIENHATNGTAAVSLNYYGYAIGHTQYRDLDIYNGKGEMLARFAGDGHGLLVGIGSHLLTPDERRLRVVGGHFTATMQLYSFGDGWANDASLDFWASEPGQTYKGAGIGSNVNKHPYYGTRNSAAYGGYLRFREDGAISLGTAQPGTGFTDRVLANTYGTLMADVAGLNLAGAVMSFDDSGVRSWQLQATGGNIRLSSGDGNGAFVGAGDGTMDLGAYDKRWRDAHIGRFLIVGAGESYHQFPSWSVIGSGIGYDGDLLLAVAGGAAYFRRSGYCNGSSTAALALGHHSSSGRSLDATGTINANGADYAEHEQNNGHRIIKGQIVGFDTDGKLTTQFSEALRFAVKSTDPGYTGGNTWMDSLPPRPNKPVLHDVQRRSYGESDEVNPDAEVDALIEQEYQEALVAAEIEYQSELAQYERDKTAFDKAMAEAVSKVDRIAYCGKVPVNCYNASPGDYLIASSTDEDLITCYPVRDPVYSEYLRCIGRVNKILPDGRAEIAVITH